MRVDEIKQKLDELGIEYDEKLKKDELLKLLNDQDEVNDEIDSEEVLIETVADSLEKDEEAPKRYVVVHDFKDLKDNDTIYKTGDIFPRRVDSQVDEERIAELSSKDNKIGKVLIKETD